MAERSHHALLNTLQYGRRLAFLLLALAVSLAHAGEADVVDVKVRRSAPDGKVLGRRILLHPHKTEQPFTRDLYGVRIPADIAEVVVRARHKPKGYDGNSIRVRLPDARR